MAEFTDVDLELDFDSEWLYISAYWGMFLNMWTPKTGFR